MRHPRADSDLTRIEFLGDLWSSGPEDLSFKDVPYESGVSNQVSHQYAFELVPFPSPVSGDTLPIDFLSTHVVSLVRLQVRISIGRFRVSEP